MKVLVVHPAQQHSYRLATALKQRGRLYKYITTVYHKKGSFTCAAALFLKGNFRKKAQARVCNELCPNDVVQFCEAEGLLKLLAMNTTALRPYYKKIKYHTADRFAKKVVRYAVRHQVDAVVSFDDCSSVLFDLLAKNAPDILRIMDMSAANILYMRQIYDRDSELKPEFSARLHKEREIVWCEENICRAETELKNAQLFLAPSDFVARSLKYSGISDDRIKICPYGVDTRQFKQKDYHDFEILSSRPIRFIYVGGVKELKGISYLLEAIDALPASQAELTVVGQCNKEDNDISPYLNRVTFTGSVLHSEIPELLADADVFVFPSLGEGMSLSTLEAAACGLPLIVTVNSGVNDAISDGKEGFVIPIQSAEAIKEKMQWFIENSNQIESMGRAARELALHYTWDAYYQRVNQIFDDLDNVVWEK